MESFPEGQENRLMQGSGRTFRYSGDFPIRIKAFVPDGWIQAAISQEELDPRLHDVFRYVWGSRPAPEVDLPVSLGDGELQVALKLVLADDFDCEPDQVLLVDSDIEDLEPTNPGAPDAILGFTSMEQPQREDFGAEIRKLFDAGFIEAKDLSDGQYLAIFGKPRD